MFNQLDSSALRYIIHIDTYNNIESAAKYQIDTWPQEITLACKYMHNTYIQHTIDNNLSQITPLCIEHLLENNAYDLIWKYTFNLNYHSTMFKKYVLINEGYFNYSDIRDIISEFYAKRNKMVAQPLIEFYNKITCKTLIGFYIKYQNLSHIQDICDKFELNISQHMLELQIIFSPIEIFKDISNKNTSDNILLWALIKIVKYSSVEKLNYIIDNNIYGITPRSIGEIVLLKSRAIKFMFDTYPDDIDYSNIIFGLIHDIKYLDYIQWDKVSRSKLKLFYIDLCKIGKVELLKKILPYIPNHMYLSGLDCYVRSDRNCDYIQVNPDVTKLVLDYLIANNLSYNTYIQFAYKKIICKNATELTEYDKCMVDYYAKIITQSIS